ncbi:uncharacterized protein LOC122536271 [Frieseomelitta varia]|nr:uncharacterized protein LOC122536271 [Frieseomelitta varia]
MSDEEDIDINKKFEDLLLAEENAQDIGYKEGFEFGKKHFVTAFHYGHHKGSSLGAQLGYYSGILEQYLSTNECNTEKSVSIARKLLQDIYNVPKFNDETVDMLKTIDNIKSQYAKFCALAKICSSYPETDKLNF